MGHATLDMHECYHHQRQQPYARCSSSFYQHCVSTHLSIRVDAHDGRPGLSCDPHDISHHDRLLSRRDSQRLETRHFQQICNEYGRKTEKGVNRCSQRLKQRVDAQFE